MPALSTPLIGACLSPQQASTLTPAHALDFLEVNIQSFLLPSRPDSDFLPQLHLARATRQPITAANCFLPPALKSAGPHAQPDAIRAYATTAFRRARSVGIRTIIFGSGASRQLPEDLSPTEALPQFIALLRSLGPLAETFGVTLALEPLNHAECNFIHTIAEGASVIRAVDHLSIRLTADLYHMARNGELWSHLADAADLLAHIHVAEIPHRTPPGTEGVSWAEPFSILKKSRYAGALSIEASWSHPTTQAPIAAQILREQWHAA